MDDVDLHAWCAEAKDLAERTFGQLQQALQRLPPSLRWPAHVLLSRRSDVTEEIDTLLPSDLKAMKTRVHGAYHLGQVLMGPRDIYIVGFAGTSLRSPDARRAKHSPVRDVAGMLRSFCDAAAAAGRSPDVGPSDFKRLRACSRDMSKAFLSAYRQAVLGCSAIPTEADDMDRLLRFFLMEKILDQLSRELENRSEWPVIPLCDVQAILDSGAGGRFRPPGEAAAAQA
ncbi:hypothetical protein [Arenibaculum pallidiluteum]|uniref:hypothetical protein n=1 Tax=Arenibaculum pallidiluteum TaxID=2812559 RepID=UPI001A96D827|nr:hypothetical protein [Arenibaculum pallidiluteum]